MQAEGMQGLHLVVQAIHDLDSSYEGTNEDSAKWRHH